MSCRSATTRLAELTLVKSLLGVGVGQPVLAVCAWMYVPGGVPVLAYRTHSLYSSSTRPRYGLLGSTYDTYIMITLSQTIAASPVLSLPVQQQ